MTATLTDILAHATGRYGDHSAVEDPGTGEKLTYQDLGARADVVRDSLKRHGLVPGDRVGICASKSCGVVASIHGILSAAAAYVPVDSTSPRARIAGIFADCAVAFIVVEASAAADLRLAMGEPLELLEEWGNGLQLLRGIPQRERREPENRPPAEADVAYILYTSGSTGKPKGVVHTHASAMSFVQWCSETFEPSSTDRFSSHAPFHFDLSILDLFVPVAHGASVVLIGEEAGKQPQGLAALISGSRISIWYSTPSILRLLADYGRVERHDLSALRLILFAGEVFPVNHLRKLMSIVPGPRFFNLYGPTETNVCTFYEVPAGLPGDSQIPIGRMCSNDRGRVVDEHGGDVTEGELVVSGGTVMQGYWNLPERSQSAFLHDADGVRWYRTGDIVVEGSEGYLFRGRRDRMVKRRGYRVELGEIEAALARHPALSEAAVTAVTDEEAGVRIHAHLVARDSTGPSIIALKQFCASNLPAYMVPDKFILNAAIPKTSTGKIDYRSLAGATR